jgi:flavin reductase (DIM6/NTAB) family NADH-FMN oxidoreductase RutF
LGAQSAAIGVDEGYVTMKIDLPVIPPADIQQGWDGQFQVFSWYNFVLNIPTAVFIVTTQKENGLPNAQLNAWGMLLGSGREPKFVLQLMNNSDTLRLIRANQEFVVNLPSYDLKQRFIKTTVHYPHEVDEITASGLTPEPCQVVSAPRVKECYAHYECVLDWLKEVETETPVNTLVVGNVVHAAVEEEYLLPEVRASFTKRAIPYHFGEFYNHQDRRCSGGEGSGFCQLDVKGFDFAG